MAALYNGECCNTILMQERIFKLIKIDDLTKSYGSKKVFNRLNMNIEKTKSPS